MHGGNLVLPGKHNKEDQIKINMAGRNPKPAPPSNPIVQFFGQFKGAFQKSPKITIDKKTMENVWKLMDKVRMALICVLSFMSSWV